MQLSLSLPDPREQSSLPILKRVQVGISRVRLGWGQPSWVRLPITAQVLHRIKGALECSAHPEKELLRAVSCTAFLAFSPRTAATVFSQPKAAPGMGGHGSGQYSIPTDDKVPSEDRPLWPHSAREDKDEPLLCSSCIDLHDGKRHPPDPFFITSAKLPLTQSEFVAAIRKVLAAVCRDSFRIGRWE